jgi:hypothetical protein
VDVIQYSQKLNASELSTVFSQLLSTNSGGVIIRLTLNDPSILINNCMTYNGAQLNKNQFIMKSTHKSHLTYFCYDSGLSSALSNCTSPVSDNSHD